MWILVIILSSIGLWQGGSSTAELTIETETVEFSQLTSQQTIGEFAGGWRFERDPHPKEMRECAVYLLGGQSNMQGLGQIAELGAEVPCVIPHALFWNGETFEPLVVGKSKTSARLTEFGPELGFALEMATEDCPIYIIKYHASGMPLHHGFDGANWIGGEPTSDRKNFYPGEGANDPTCGTLYVAMRATYLAGVAHLQDNGQRPIVRGFLWMQGEQDAKEAIAATNYAASLQRLRRRLAEDLGIVEPLRFAFGQVLPHTPARPRFKYRHEIREQMAACDQDSGRPEAMLKAIMISTESFSLLADTVHYDTDGQLQLGKAFARALKQLE